LPQRPPGRPTPTGGEESNGLGLAIVKHLVESQGGTTGAEFPEKTGGSLFWFELQVAT
jgi:K+-sensing histidine kinase KdpD